MSIARSLLAALLFAPLAAWSAGSATIAGGDRTFTLEYAGQNLRLQDDQRPGIHLLSRDGALYAVTSAAGQPIVVTGQAIAGLLSARGGGQFATGSEDIQRLVSLTDTGRTETVAGIRGSVHRLIYIDRSDRERTEDVVLASDRELAELTQRFGQAAITFQQGTGVDNQGARELMHELSSRGLGLLRFADHYEVTRLDRTPPDPARFALPGTPMQMPGISGLESLIPGLRR